MKKTEAQIVLLPYFKMFIRACTSGRRQTPAGKKISAGTIRNYQYALQLIEEFETKKDVELRIQLLHRASLRTLQKEKNYWSRFFIQFSTFLYNEKGYYDNYTATVLKVIKTFFNYLQTEKGFSIGNYHKSFRVPVQIKAPVVLQPEQLNFLITNKEFENQLSFSLKRARDIFVFGCTVALRVSDLMNLKKTNIISTEKEVYLHVNTQKTGAEVRIPLPDYALQIVEHYKNKEGKYILPRLSARNLNIQVKNLIEKAGWTHTLAKTINRKGKVIELKKPNGASWKFHEHITAHTMRRTAITTLLIMGVPEYLVRKISGHAPGSKEFYKYVAIAQEYLSKEVQAAYKKLINDFDILPAKQEPQLKKYIDDWCI